jgi:hypothetical protein
MTPEELKALNVGDIIRHRGSYMGMGAAAMVVTGNYGDHVTAVRTVNVSNPDEWDLLAKTNWGEG